MSTRSNGSVTAGDKKQKKTKKKAEQKVSSRKSSLDWQPNPEHEKKVKGVKEYKFSRLDSAKYDNLLGAAKDNSYEAKKLFGTTGDTYGDWSNDKLKDKVGKGFTKEKNKMKNRNFHASGGRFNMGAVNSVLM